MKSGMLKNNRERIGSNVPDTKKKGDEVIKAQKDDPEFQQIFPVLNGEELNQYLAKDAKQCLTVD